jgi:hypothetical protein
MDAVTPLLRNEMFGFFELDDHGVVRYSRPRIDEADGGDSLIGQNFFELTGLLNREGLRSHFRKFIESRQAADSFTFDCSLDWTTIRAKVTLTRAFQTEYFPPESIVMLDIREVGF